MGQPLHLRGCLLLAAASYGAAPDARARARLRGPAANASSALVLKDRRLPEPTSRALAGRRRLSGDYAQLAQLVASDAAASDHFGYSVAIDGDTVVVGADRKDSWTGAVYVLRTADGWDTYTEIKLTAADAAASDMFGRSVAIAGDTVVVGASGDDDGGSGSGSAYIFRTSDGGATYGQVAKLTASDAAQSDLFGHSVAIDGNTVVVGAYYKSSGTGAVYVFRTSDGGATYGQVAKLTASDGASYDNFGWSVAIDGDTIVVGSYGDDDAGSSSGSAYVFRTTDGGATYGLVAKLTASDAASIDYFGNSVAIDGSTIVIGAQRDGDGYYFGSAYVFRTSDGGVTYDQVAKLTAADGAAFDYFGNSVAISSDTVVVGAWQWDELSTGGAGSAYVFRTTDDGATYPQVGKLTASDGAAGDWFGSSVAIDGSTIVAGAYQDDDAGSYSGSAYVFLAPRTSSWPQLAKMVAGDAAASDYFGWSLAASGDLVAVGAYGDDSSTGSVYILRMDSSVAAYTQLVKLTAADAAANDYFGASVAIDGNTVVVGAYGDDDAGSYSGSVYVFHTSDGGATYSQVAKLTADDAASGDSFGKSVAIDGDTVVIGAFLIQAPAQGSVYVFRTTDGGATYGQVAKLTAADAAAWDHFGRSVAIDGNIIVVGNDADDDASDCTASYCESGSAYVFRTTDGGATYDQVAKLTAADGAAFDYFGRSVAIAGDTIVVGAYGKDSYTGSVYVFRTTDSGATYGQVAKLTAADAAASDRFGATLVEGSTISTSMAIDGSHAAQLEDSFRGGLSVGWADKVEGGLGFIKNIFAAGLQGGFGYATTPVDISVSRSTSRHFDIGISFSTTISTSDSPYLAGQPSDVIVGGGANLRFISAIEISGALKAAVSGSFGGGFNIGRRRLETTDKGVPGYAYPTSGRVLAVSKKLLEVTPDALEERRRKLEAEFTDQAHRKLPGDDVELAGFNPLYNGAPGAAPAEKPTPAPARSPHQAHRKLPASAYSFPGVPRGASFFEQESPMRGRTEGSSNTPAEKPEPASNPCNRRLDGTDLSDEERRRLGMTFCGKFDGGTAASFSVSLGRATNKESGQSHAIAVSLKDGNAQDVFAVKISQDTVYGTPIFTTMGGSSS